MLIGVGTFCSNYDRNLSASDLICSIIQNVTVVKVVIVVKIVWRFFVDPGINLIAHFSAIHK